VNTGTSSSDSPTSSASPSPTSRTSEVLNAVVSILALVVDVVALCKGAPYELVVPAAVAIAAKTNLGSVVNLFRKKQP